MDARAFEYAWHEEVRGEVFSPDATAPGDFVRAVADATGYEGVDLMLQTSTLEMREDRRGLAWRPCAVWWIAIEDDWAKAFRRARWMMLRGAFDRRVWVCSRPCADRAISGGKVS